MQKALGIARKAGKLGGGDTSGNDGAKKSGIVARASKFLDELPSPPYTLAALGSSRILTPFVHMLMRCLLGAAFIGVGIAAFGRGVMVALPVLIIYALLFFVLGITCHVQKTRGGKTEGAMSWVMAKEAQVLGIVYHVLASVAFWIAPIALMAASRNLVKGGRKRNHALKYYAHVLPFCAVLVDCTLLGAAPRFHWIGIIPSLLVEGVMMWLGVKFGSVQPPKGNALTEPMLKMLRMMFKVFLWLVGAWAVVAAGLVYFSSRASTCCMRQEVTGDEERPADVAAGDVTEPETAAAGGAQVTGGDEAAV